MGGHDLHHVGHGLDRRVAQVDREQLVGLGEVDVGIDQAGRDRAAGQVDHLRIGPGQSLHLRRGADRRDAAAGDRDGFGHESRASTVSTAPLIRIVSGRPPAGWPWRASTSAPEITAAARTRARADAEVRVMPPITERIASLAQYGPPAMVSESSKEPARLLGHECRPFQQTRRHNEVMRLALALVVATAMTVSLQAQRPAPAEHWCRRSGAESSGRPRALRSTS